MARLIVAGVVGVIAGYAAGGFVSFNPYVAVQAFSLVPGYGDFRDCKTWCMEEHEFSDEPKNARRSTPSSGVGT